MSDGRRVHGFGDALYRTQPRPGKLTRVPCTFRWSSAEAHASGADPARLLDLGAWSDLVPGVNWKEMLTESGEKEATASLRLNTRTRRPLASDSLLSKLEQALGRSLRPLPVGRPKKKTSENIRAPSRKESK